MGKSIKKYLPYSFIALCLFVLLLALFLRIDRTVVRKELPTQAPQLVVLGDSIFAYYQGETALAKLLAADLQVSVADGSFGGTAAGYLDREGRLAYTGDSFCLAALTQAICSGDFRLQEQADIRSSATEYYQERLLSLEQVDFSRVEVLVIEQGLNDYQSGAPLEITEKGKEAYSYLGALRWSITEFQRKYPNLKIVLVSSPFVWYEDGNGDNIDRGYGTLTQFVEAQQTLAKQLQVEWVDWYHDGYGNPFSESWETYTIDGVHPNELGKELLKNALLSTLETYF